MKEMKRARGRARNSHKERPALSNFLVSTFLVQGKLSVNMQISGKLSGCIAIQHHTLLGTVCIHPFKTNLSSSCICTYNLA